MWGDTFPPESNRLSIDEDFSSLGWPEHLDIDGKMIFFWVARWFLLTSESLNGCGWYFSLHLATDHPVDLPPKTPPVLVALPGFLKATIAFFPIIIEIFPPSRISRENISTSFPCPNSLQQKFPKKDRSQDALRRQRYHRRLPHGTLPHGAR